MSYLFRILSCLIVFMVLNNALFGQYDPENEVVTISKYHLKPLSEVENGSTAERKEVFEEYARKMNPLSCTQESPKLSDRKSVATSCCRKSEKVDSALCTWRNKVAPSVARWH